MMNAFEVAISLIAALFVFVTSVIDPGAAVKVAVVAVVCLLVYSVFFRAKLLEDHDKWVKSNMPAKRTAPSKVVKSARKSKSKSKKKK